MRRNVRVTPKVTGVATFYVKCWSSREEFTQRTSWREVEMEAEFPRELDGAAEYGD